MKTFEFTEEQINAISNAIISVIESNHEVIKSIRCASDKTQKIALQTIDKENAKWQTLLNYINS